MKRERLKYSFATYREIDGGFSVDAEDVAKILAKSWRDIPIRLNNARAWEIYCLALAYLALRKKLKEVSK